MDLDELFATGLCYLLDGLNGELKPINDALLLDHQIHGRSK
jgi:hypothetical protein